MDAVTDLATFVNTLLTTGAWVLGLVILLVMATLPLWERFAQRRSGRGAVAPARAVHRGLAARPLVHRGRLAQR